MRSLSFAGPTKVDGLKGDARRAVRKTCLGVFYRRCTDRVLSLHLDDWKLQSTRPSASHSEPWEIYVNELRRARNVRQVWNSPRTTQSRYKPWSASNSSRGRRFIWGNMLGRLICMIVPLLCDRVWRILEIWGIRAWIIDAIWRAWGGLRHSGHVSVSSATQVTKVLFQWFILGIDVNRNISINVYDLFQRHNGFTTFQGL